MLSDCLLCFSIYFLSSCLNILQVLRIIAAIDGWIHEQQRIYCSFPIKSLFIVKEIFICLQKGSLYNGCSSFFHIHHASTHHYISLLSDIQFDFL
jgi:hypothetical protein